jgi:2-octaprenyl-6-methoxyphenol hydroxylase
MPEAAPDILIVGAGPVGMAAALALHAHGRGCTLADARARGAARGDRRVLALSHGSRQILERLGVWQALRGTPIRSIHVSQQGGFGRTRLRAGDYGLPALGYVVDAGLLAAALEEALTAAGIAVQEHTQVENVAGNDADAIASCRRAGAPLLSHHAAVAFAEGGLHEAADVVSRDYGQHALICNLTPCEPHEGTAWERFTEHGPVALLPRGDGYAAVFVTAPEEAKALAELPESTLLRRAEARFGTRLRFAAASARHVYPLALRYRRRPVAPRCVYLGNSAQTLHPVAGQGLNLGLRDAWCFAATAGAGTDPGAPAALARYEQARRIDRAGAIGFTDSLVRLFSNANGALRTLRGGGLFALDLLPPAREFVARRMIFGARAWP